MKDQLNQIADEIDRLSGLELANMSHDTVKMTLRSYAIAIRALASGIKEPSEEIPSHRSMIERAKGEFRGKVKPISEEEEEPRLVGCLGGPNDNDFVPVNPKMPVGARCSVNGNEYELKEDGQLHYVGEAF